MKIHFYLVLFLLPSPPELEAFTVSYYSIIPVKVERIDVPAFGVAGREAVLFCSFSPRSGIYSVSWYKNGLQFFSYLPGIDEPISVHPLPGVHVDVERSTANTVYLKNLSLESTGRYRCEVSGEGPIFPTDSKFEDMLVVSVPRRGPKIYGLKDWYRIGDTLDLNCTADHTNPPTNLTWYINQEHVLESDVIRYPIVNITRRSDTLHNAVLGISHQITRDDIRLADNSLVAGGSDQVLKLKCAASMYDIYYKVKEVKVMLEGNSRDVNLGRDRDIWGHQQVSLTTDKEVTGFGYDVHLPDFLNSGSSLRRQSLLELLLTYLPAVMAFTSLISI